MNIKLIMAAMTLLVLGAAVLTAVFDQPSPKPPMALGVGIDPHDPPPGDGDPCSPSPTQSPGE